ncbi:MAG TPA: acyltransferase [Methylomusa anaerophila]|uniref:Maltose O-acetyltransferase n=1 Tax=Methylomusa anaerophila TaxID=1930071 RepID=A0A348AGC5_9FIRM|nr:acyltransferase [Methylomusa anaerophila]BBB90123.1 maltose O-acetyltransferase [Methylomusa anaerophila]HML88153.1 acyltransferase [Methylomusa anaerophila]
MLYITAAIRIIYNFIRLTILKLFHFHGVFFRPLQLLSVRTSIDIRGRKSRLVLGNRVSARPGVTLAIRDGSLEIGDNVFFNKGCFITCHDHIKIGNDCLFGPNVIFYDHDHIYGPGKIVNKEKYTTAPVELGKNILIGANSVILRGTKIGDNCVIAAGTVVKGEIPADSIVYQKKELIIRPVVSLEPKGIS